MTATELDSIVSELPTVVALPEGVKRLKAALLERAINGGLVERRPEEGTAREFLNALGESEWHPTKVIKPSKRAAFSPTTLFDDVGEHAGDIPEHWGWVPFGRLVINLDACRVPLSRADRESLQGKYDYYGASGIIDPINDFIFDGDLLLIGEDGANLLNRSTPIAFVASGQYWVNNHAHIVDTVHPETMAYLSLYINAIDLKPYVTGTAQPKMNQVKMNSIPIAVPPLAEQRRIVDKVQEIFDVIDPCNLSRPAPSLLDPR